MTEPPPGAASSPEPEPGQQPAPPPYGTPPGYGPPYGTPPGYGLPPSYGGPPGYGTPPPYGAPPAGYGYPGWRDPASDAVRTQAIVALVVGIVLGLMCCLPGGVGAAVTAGLAMSRADRDVASARRLLRWSCGLTVASVVVGIGFVVAFVAFSGDPGFPPQN